jgi:hypothetical protein
MEEKKTIITVFKAGNKFWLFALLNSRTNKMYGKLII